MTHRLLVTALLAALLLWAGGCSEKATEPIISGDTNLDDEFGGYTASAEPPAFGDPEILGDEESESGYDDPLLSSLSVDSLITDPQVGRFHLRAIWGRLRYDSTVTEVTDWTGSLSISRGAVILRRVIRFEPNQDEILPRTDPKAIGWKSFTTVHNDGIAVDLFVPPPRPTFDTTIVISDTDTLIAVDTVWPGPVTVKYDTGPYSRTLTLGELASLDTIVQLDDSNAVALHAMRIFRVSCPRGFLAGRWGYDEEGKGVFKGIWTDRYGFITGHLRGRFGRNQAGDRVFFGKWIDRLGRCNGLIRGIWAPHPAVCAGGAFCGRARGWFEGKIYTADRVEIGALKGQYRGSAHYSGGFFQGRWKLHCDLRPHDVPGNEALDDGF